MIDAECNINPKYNKQFAEEASKGLIDNSVEAELKKIKAKLHEIVKSQLTIEEEIRKKYVEIVKREVLKEVKRTTVTYEQWIEFGMYECIEDILEDEALYETFKEPDNWGFKLRENAEPRLRELYKQLVKEDSEDTVIYISDIFKDYSGDKYFFSLDLLTGSIDSEFKDNAEQLQEEVKVTLPLALDIYSKEDIKDFDYKDAYTELCKEGLYKKKDNQ